MQDKVGAVIPSAKEIEARRAEVSALAEAVAKYTLLLSLEERTRTLKPRTGFEAIASKMGVMAEKHGVALPKISIAGMMADVTLADRLQPLRDSVASFLQRLDDTILEARSEAYWAATAYYTALARMSSADPELEADLKPIVDFFAITPRAKAADAAPAVAPTVAAK